MPIVRTRRPRSATSAPRRIGILVIGMHRSGTSAVTRTLNLLGAALPANLMAAAPDNIAGFWESADIMAVHERFLEAIGSGWDDPQPLDAAAFATPAAATCHDDLLAILHRDLGDAPVFVVKDPRCCRLLPLWRRVLESFGAAPMAVLPVRHPLEAVLSLRLRNDLAREHAVAMWLAHSLAAERGSRDWPRQFVRYDAFLAEPGEAARQLAARLGCFPEAKVTAALGEIEAFWSAELRHHQYSDSDMDALPSWVRSAYGWMVEAAQGAEPEVAPIEAMGAALDDVTELYGPLIGRPDHEARQAVEALRGELEGCRDGVRVEADARQAAEALLHQAREGAAGLAAERDLLAGLVERMRGEREDLACELGRAHEDNFTLRGQAAALGGELGRMRAERSELTDSLSAQQAELALARAEAAALTERLSARDAELVWAQAEVADGGVRLAAAHAALDQARGELGALQGELERARRDHREVRAALAAAGNDAARREAEGRAVVVELERTRDDLAVQTADLSDRVRRTQQVVTVLARIAIGRHGRISWIRRLGGLARAALLFRLGRRLAEDRDIDTIVRSGRFDAVHYLTHSPDVAAQGIDPIVHYVRWGAREGRDPHPGFDAGTAGAGSNPLAHSIRLGWGRGNG